MTRVKNRGAVVKLAWVSVGLWVLGGCGGESRDVSPDAAGVDGPSAIDIPEATNTPGDDRGTDDASTDAAGTGVGSGMDTGAAGNGSTGTGEDPSNGDDAGNDVDPSSLGQFSFFVTSLEIMRELSGSPDGFGGDLGGLAGADEICRQAADRVGFGAKTWRAFLSATDDGSGNPVHAIDRIGAGPWYDANGRLIADDVAGLLAGDRPAGDAAAVNDLPNEFGEGLQQMGDTHDILTGSNAQGQLDSPEPENTCNDWTSTTVMPIGGGFGFPGTGGWGMDPSGGGTMMGGGGPQPAAGGLRVGHSWPAFSGMHWIASHSETSCAPGVNLVQNGPGDGSSVGAGGGWGAFYCFALEP